VSRIDHVGEAKEVLQAASVIGPEFTLDLLAGVVGGEAGSLAAAIERAALADLVVEAPGARRTFAFRHGLLRDAAYATLLRRQRRSLHERVARLLIAEAEAGPADGAAPPGLIALHCREGGLVTDAIAYYHLAATRSMATGANAEALRFVDEATALLDGVPAGAERAATELTLLTARGPALMAELGYGHPSVEETFRRAHELCDELGDRLEIFPVLYGLVAYAAVRCDLATASRLAERVRHSAEQASDDGFTMLAHAASAQTLFLQGDFVHAEEQALRCAAKHDPDRQADYRITFGEDPGTVCRGVAAWLAWLRGRPEEALALMDQAVAGARALDHHFTLAETLLVAARLHHYRKDPDAIREVVGEALDIATRHGFPLFCAEAACWLGWADAVEHRDHGGLERLRDGLAAFRASGAEMFVPHHLVLQGEAAWALGDREAAVAAFTEARSRAARLGNLDHQVEALRLSASAMAGDPGRTAEAEALLVEAADLARAQGAVQLAVRVGVTQVHVAGERGDPRALARARRELADRCRELAAASADRPDVAVRPPRQAVGMHE
jgi:tetratricopeptide (TPR) repeat protein